MIVTRQPLIANPKELELSAEMVKVFVNHVDSFTGKALTKVSHIIFPATGAIEPTLKLASSPGSLGGELTLKNV